MIDLTTLIRTIPNYPKPGIQFRDITTLLGHPDGLRQALDQLAEGIDPSGVDKVAGIEARGFILGGAIAATLHCGFVPIRKRGKLPSRTVTQRYELEYGTDEVEMHVDAIKDGERVLVIDDLIATGGTAEAAVRLLKSVGANVLGARFVIELPELGGRERIEKLDCPVSALVVFAGH